MNAIRAVAVLAILFIWGCASKINRTKISSANAHSHNDYSKPEPFYKAYNAGFGSIEADVYLRNDTLFVTHHPDEIKHHHTLESLYLLPLKLAIIKNGGKAYKKTKRLQLLIDIKSAAEPTLNAIIKSLEKHTEIINPKSQVDIVISGNRPTIEKWKSSPTFIYFDGRPFETYAESDYKKIRMISASASYFIKSKEITKEQRDSILKFVADTKKRDIKTRLWGMPDEKEIWQLQKDLGLDYIGTDNIAGLLDYLSR